MTKQLKIILLSLTLFFVGVATVLGVFAAKTVSSLPLGKQVTMESLDPEEDKVGMINFLIIGVDEDGTRSDTIMLVSYDGYSNRVNILSLPRDTKVRLNNQNQKLNAAMGVGIYNVKTKKDDEPEEEMIRQVKSLTGLPIHYFVTVGFDGFKEVIDALDGVDFYVPYNMDYDDPAQDLHIHLTAGQKHMDGQMAHDFVRFRHNNDGSAPGEYVRGDEGRIYWQQKFLKELSKQKLNPKYFSKITDVFDVIADNVRTNYTLKDLLKHVSALQKIRVDEIGSYQLPGEAVYEDFGNGNGIWWYQQDVLKTEELIRSVFLPKSIEQWEKEKALIQQEAETEQAEQVKQTEQVKQAEQKEQEKKEKSNNNNYGTDLSL